MSVNWCTSCKCVLANEEVVGGVCERCGGEVIHKVKNQWMLGITQYAQRLIDDLDGVDYIDRVKTSQINWIGRSTGAEIDFETTAGDTLTVFSTRPDTLYGATYMVIAPEHPYIEQWADRITNLDALRAYQAEAARKSDFERSEMAADKEKTGVCIEGVRGINPVTGKEIPIFISDYVLMTYGTGAIMAVPGHDDARLGLCQEVRPAHHRSGSGRQCGRGSLYRLQHRHHGQQRYAGRTDRGRGQEEDHRVAGRNRQGP